MKSEKFAEILSDEMTYRDGDSRGKSFEGFSWRKIDRNESLSVLISLEMHPHSYLAGHCSLNSLNQRKTVLQYTFIPYSSKHPASNLFPPHTNRFSHPSQLFPSISSQKHSLSSPHRPNTTPAPTQFLSPLCPSISSVSKPNSPCSQGRKQCKGT